MMCVIGNVKFSILSFSNAIAKASNSIESGKHCHQIIFANAYSVVLANNNQEFKSACDSADIILPDGISIVFASILLGKVIKERIPGPDFMWKFSEICAEKNYKIFLLGSDEHYLARLAENLQTNFYKLQIVGIYPPPFDSWDKENEKIIDSINLSGADVVWVGVSSPKQDIWIMKNKDRLNAKIAIGVGAAFDFYSGRVKRSPKTMQKIGLEWLHRLVTDPNRLWRRYLIGNLQFIYYAILYNFRSK